MTNVAPVARERQLAGLQDAAVVVAQDRQQDGVAHLPDRRSPTRRRRSGVATRRTVLQHVPPAGVVRAADGHVIGHDVEDLAEAVLAEGRAEALVRDRAAQLRVDAARIDDVVAVRAARRGLEVRATSRRGLRRAREVVG